MIYDTEARERRRAFFPAIARMSRFGFRALDLHREHPNVPLETIGCDLEMLAANRLIEPVRGSGGGRFEVPLR